MGKFTDNLVSKNKGLGDCYKVSANFITSNTQLPGCILVHGRPTLQCAPFVQYSHAWVEIPSLDIALNVATGRQIAVPLSEFYATGQIDSAKCYRYTPEQARQMLLTYEHYGPWEGPDGIAPPASLA